MNRIKYWILYKWQIWSYTVRNLYKDFSIELGTILAAPGWKFSKNFFGNVILSVILHDLRSKSCHFGCRAEQVKSVLVNFRPIVPTPAPQPRLLGHHQWHHCKHGTCWGIWPDWQMPNTDHSSFYCGKGRWKKFMAKWDIKDWFW